MLFDPIPTPAGRSGRPSVLAGVVAWVLAVTGGALLAVGESDPDPRVGGFFGGAGQMALGVAAVLFLVGMLFAASGYTKLMIGAPDSGLRWVLAGFALNAAPMVLLGLYGAYRVVESKMPKAKPEPPADVRPGALPEPAPVPRPAVAP